MHFPAVLLNAGEFFLAAGRRRSRRFWLGAAGVFGRTGGAGRRRRALLFYVEVVVVNGFSFLASRVLLTGISFHFHFKAPLRVPDLQSQADYTALLLKNL
jgi:hypothetical protein